MQPVISEAESTKVYPVHIDDIARAVLNSFKNQGTQNLIEINAVGDDGYSLSEFFRFYTKTLKNKFTPIEISLEEFELIATNFPHGHIAKYAADYLKLDNSSLCNKSFKNLVAQDGELLRLTSIRDTFNNSEKGVEDLAINNPFIPYVVTVSKQIITSPNKIIPLSKSLLPIILRGTNKLLKHKWNALKNPLN